MYIYAFICMCIVLLFTRIQQKIMKTLTNYCNENYPVSIVVQQKRQYQPILNLLVQQIHSSFERVI